jgi:hypothetical protein
MKVIIAGGRYLKNWEIVKVAIENCDFHITEVVSGGAAGADSIGEGLARATVTNPASREGVHI